jgi:tRNA(Ile)-lysidine synthase
LYQYIIIDTDQRRYTEITDVRMPHAPSNPFPEIAAFFESVGASPAVPASVVVGVSGGADSIALLHILHRYRGDFGIGRLAAAHVNHGLRGAESDGDEDFARNEAAKLGVEFFSVRLNYRGSGIEAWARRERYKFFSEVRRERGIDWAATAHTADDQAETVLLRLTRGAGLRGLRGILPVRGDGVIRPMLGVERRRLSEWLSERGIGHRVDSSNAELRFRRNRIRAEVVPKLVECDPAAVRNIAAAAVAAQTAWREIEGRTGEWIERYVLRVSSEIFHVEKAGLAVDGGMGVGVVPPVREALLVLFDEHGIAPSRLHIERVTAALSGRFSGGEHLLPGGWTFYCREDRVCFVKKDRGTT